MSKCRSEAGRNIRMTKFVIYRFLLFRWEWDARVYEWQNRAPNSKRLQYVRQPFAVQFTDAELQRVYMKLALGRRFVDALVVHRDGANVAVLGAADVGELMP